MITHRFTAMSSDAYVAIVGGPRSLVALAERRAHELERRWSRFLPSSEINRLNAAGGEALAVSTDTVRLIAAACDAWAFTGGRYDPTVLDAMLHLGYERSIETVRAGLAEALCAVPAVGCDGIEIDEVAGTVRLPLGVRLDAGGIGKGLAADLISEELLRAGARGAMVSLGGDLRVRGEGPHPDGWSVGIEHPLRRTCSLAAVQLVDGAVATSSRMGRRWRRMDGMAHHLLNARTGRPTVGVTAVTVIAATGAWADALTKVCCTDPAGAALDGWLGKATAIVVHDDGEVRVIGTPLSGLQLAA